MLKSCRKYRITSRFRFTVFLTIAAVLAAILLYQVFSVGTVHGESYQTYRVVTVEQGDTLWDIAGRYTPDNTDVRKTISIIMSANDMNAPDDLQAGQELLVPEETA